MNFTYNNANYHPAGITTASIAIATAYNKDPDADFIIRQPAGSSKTTRGSMTHDEIKKMINKVYGATKYTREAMNV